MSWAKEKESAAKRNAAQRLVGFIVVVVCRDSDDILTGLAISYDCQMWTLMKTAEAFGPRTRTPAEGVLMRTQRFESVHDGGSALLIEAVLDEGSVDGVINALRFCLRKL